VIHRDIKPKNILVDDDGNITVRSDLYSIEAVMCGLFTGEMPTGRFPDRSELDSEINSRLNGLFYQLFTGCLPEGVTKPASW